METSSKIPETITPRRYGGAGVIVLLIFLAAGCGIPNYAYLEPPTLDDKFFEDRIASFYSAMENNPDIFKGYQVYGKFFSNSEIGSTTISTQRELENQGYDKLVTPLDADGNSWRHSPLILLTETEKGESIRFTFDFTGDNPGSASGYNTKISYSGKEVSVARLLNTATPIKNFSEADLIPDDREDDPIDGGDLPSDFPSPEVVGDLYLYLSIYIVSYGTDSDLSPVYSVPLNLGVVELAVDEALGW
jgi:hypothetical protein